MRIDEEIEAFFGKGTEEVTAAMEEAGRAAVDHNVENGDYRDRTGNLRRSNFYDVTEEALRVGNTAPYASDVEARGRTVVSGGALLALKILEEKCR